jgi:hypothetical protein
MSTTDDAAAGPGGAELPAAAEGLAGLGQHHAGRFQAGDGGTEEARAVLPLARRG